MSLRINLIFPGLIFLLLLSVGNGCALHPPGRVLVPRPTATPAGHQPVLVSVPLPTATPARPQPAASPPSSEGIGSAPSPTPTQLPVLVFLDPGHGGVDTGTIGTTEARTAVDEKDIALAIALRTAAHLRHDGIGVALSRTDDTLPGLTPADLTSDGTALTPEGVLADLQRRIDRANASGARVLLSIHLEGFAYPSVRGAETFYDSSRPFSARRHRFAELVQSDLIRSLRAQGYATPDRCVTDDLDLVTDGFGTLGANYNHLVLLGPGVPGRLRPSTMPDALSEPLFLTDPAEATAATQPAMQELIATAYAQAIEQFLRP